MCPDTERLLSLVCGVSPFALWLPLMYHKAGKHWPLPHESTNPPTPTPTQSRMRHAKLVGGFEGTKPGCCYMCRPPSNRHRWRLLAVKTEPHHIMENPLPPSPQSSWNTAGAAVPQEQPYRIMQKHVQ